MLDEQSTGRTATADSAPAPSQHGDAPHPAAPRQSTSTLPPPAISETTRSNSSSARDGSNGTAAGRSHGTIAVPLVEPERLQPELSALAQRVATARGKLPLQADPALLAELSDREIAAERDLAEWIRTQRRRQRKRAVSTELSAEKRDRKVALALRRADDADARWHRRARAARMRVSNPDARLAQLFRRAEWSSRALIGVVVLGMVWAGVNVQHNLVPSGDMSDPLYWLSYGFEAMISIPIITIMVVATTAARWGRDIDRGKVVFLETALLGVTIALNAGPHLVSGAPARAAEAAVAPVMVGVVIWLHAWVSARYAQLIDDIPLDDHDTDLPPRYSQPYDACAPTARADIAWPPEFPSHPQATYMPAAQQFPELGQIYPAAATGAPPHAGRPGFGGERVAQWEPETMHEARTACPEPAAQRMTPGPNGELSRGDDRQTVVTATSTHTEPGAPEQEPTRHRHTGIVGSRDHAADPELAEALDDVLRSADAAACPETSAATATVSPASTDRVAVCDPAQDSHSTTGQHSVTFTEDAVNGSYAPQSGSPARADNHPASAIRHPRHVDAQLTSQDSGSERQDDEPTRDPHSASLAGHDATTTTAVNAPGTTQSDANIREQHDAGSAERRLRGVDTAAVDTAVVTVGTSEAGPRTERTADEARRAAHTSGATERSRPARSTKRQSERSGERPATTLHVVADETRKTRTRRAVDQATQLVLGDPVSDADTTRQRTKTTAAEPVSHTHRAAVIEFDSAAEDLGLGGFGIPSRPVSTAGDPDLGDPSIPDIPVSAAEGLGVGDPGMPDPPEFDDLESADLEPELVDPDDAEPDDAGLADAGLEDVSDEAIDDEVAGEEDPSDGTASDVDIWTVAREIRARGLSKLPVEQLAEILTLTDESWTPAAIGASVGLPGSRVLTILETARRVRLPLAVGG